MAFTIPETITSRPGSATPGERKVFVALRDYLPEDYLVYYDIPVKGRYPDFIIVGPDLGLVVLEVKDWRLASIAAVTRDGVVLRLADGEHVVANPIQQARDYMLKTVDVLKSRPLLADRGNLRCGWGCGAIFPTLKRKDVETPSLFGPSLEQALGPGLVLTGDDLKGDSILSSLRRLIPDWAAARREPLNPLQVDEIRASLFPEIRIGWGPTDDEIFRVMNREQERLALTLGEGHRLLRGVAGSGKTICLIYRARHLRARYPDWRILVVCFNRVLAAYLRDAIGADQRLEVLHFHQWCRRELEAAGVRIPAPPATGDRSDYWNREIPRLLLQAYESHQPRSGTYQAILVDEGQDFADDWYRALLRALDRETNSLFIALDSSQSIYKRKLSWREIGIQIVGHTRVLRVNYRNTRQILPTAYAMIQELDAAGMAARETGDEYVAPDKVLRDGPAVEIRRSESEEASRQHALEWIRERLARGAAPEEILVLGLSRLEMLSLEIWLNDAGIPVQLLVGRRAQPGAVRLSDSQRERARLRTRPPARRAPARAAGRGRSAPAPLHRHDAGANRALRLLSRPLGAHGPARGTGPAGWSVVFLTASGVRLHHPAAIAAQHLARDVVRGRRGEEDDGLGDVLRRAQARVQQVVDGIREAPRRLRLDRTRRDGVDEDPVDADVPRHPLRERDDAALGGRVGGAGASASWTRAPTSATTPTPGTGARSCASPSGPPSRSSTRRSWARAWTRAPASSTPRTARSPASTRRASWWGASSTHNHPGGSGLMAGSVFGRLAGESAATD